MGPADVLLLVLLIVLTLYAILGGADFGAGIWEFSTVLQSTDKEGSHVYKAIGPVWEANHVWLIFALVILLNGFPLALAALGRTLWLPLLLALCGIVFRGASYAFRSFSQEVRRERNFWDGVFAIASTATPLFLGASVGAIASGNLPVNAAGELTADPLSGWLSPLAVFSGFYSIGLCAYLAAVYLYREACRSEDESLQILWRQCSLSIGLWMGVLSFGGLVMVLLDAPLLAKSFMVHAWPLVIVSLICGVISLTEVWRRNPMRAVMASVGAVVSVIWGWGLSQYPFLIPPKISAADAKAPDHVLWSMLIVIMLGGVLLLPALGYLFVIFKTGKASDYGPRTD